MTVANIPVTVMLSQDDYALLEHYADKYGFKEVGEAFRSLLYDFLRVSDDLWDEKFARSGQALDRLSAAVDGEIAAGRVEDFDPDNDPDAADL